MISSFTGRDAVVGCLLGDNSNCNPLFILANDEYIMPCNLPQFPMVHTYLIIDDNGLMRLLSVFFLFFRLSGINEPESWALNELVFQHTTLQNLIT